MAENKFRQSLDLIEEAFGLIAQARENLRDARELITIMEAELAQATHPTLKRLDTAEVIALRDAIEWDKGQVYLLVGEPENSEGGDRRADGE